MSNVVIVKEYKFNPATQTIEFLDYSDLRQEGIKLITNVTTGTIIYQFNDSAKVGTVAGNLLTLVFNTSAMNVNDKLMIIYDNPNGGILNSIFAQLYKIADGIRNPEYLFQAAASKYVNARIDGNSSITVGTVTTCNTVGNLTNFNGVDSRYSIWGSWDINYNAGTRSRIV